MQIPKRSLKAFNFLFKRVDFEELTGRQAPAPRVMLKPSVDTRVLFLECNDIILNYKYNCEQKS